LAPRRVYIGAPTATTANPLDGHGRAPTGSAVNLSVAHSGDITGTITYAGLQTALSGFRLYSDAALTHQVYETVIPSPSLGIGQPYGFMQSPLTRVVSCPAPTS